MHFPFEYVILGYILIWGMFFLKPCMKPLFIPAAHLKEKPTDESKLGFGRIFTDYMLVVEYEEGKGWYDPKIMPYGPIELSPAAMVLHYAQEVFEGLKAYRTADDHIQLFRPIENIRRMNRSCDRLCIPQLDEDNFMEWMTELITIEKDWVPHAPAASLYIRPFIFATDPYVGVKPSHTYKFIIILSPVGNYYPEGVKPVSIYVEHEFTRASKGGTGYTKCGGNYAASIKSQVKAGQLGYTQVLWLDGAERKYIEEVGTMNVFFKIGDEIVTPEKGDSILGGITRMSVLELLRHWGYTANERQLSVAELEEAAKAGKLVEAFGSGTAAVISPIGLLDFGDMKVTINNGEIGSVTQKLYDTLTDIQWGRMPDPFGWIKRIV